MITLLLAALIFILPPSLDDMEAELQTVFHQRQEEFRVQCYKWQRPDRCDRVIERAKVTVVDDFTFRCGGVSPSGLCSGTWRGTRQIKVALYGKLSTNDATQCEGSPIIRTREEMSALGRSRYWLTHPMQYHCAVEDVLLPALVHEMCHAFGMGHSGEDCQ